jgi:hypothetical protein
MMYIHSLHLTKTGVPSSQNQYPPVFSIPRKISVFEIDLAAAKFLEPIL